LFQQKIFDELRSEDELVVLGPGLGLLNIVCNLLHAYSTGGDKIILLIGAEKRENEWIGQSLAEHAAINQSVDSKGLTEINTDVASTEARLRIYSEGGTFSITSQILVVDMLAGLLTPSSIAGIVVLHADKVIATSIEAFILRIYREQNKDGFLKAVSDKPESFTMGFSPLARMMRNLFLQKSSFWPRFQTDVTESLQVKKKVEVIELAVPMTDSMTQIQSAIWECVDICVRELKKSNKDLDLEGWDVESALHSDFDIRIRRQLDPIWHRVSYRTRQMVNDLSTLRPLLFKLLTMDCVTFLEHLDHIRATHTPPEGSTKQNESPWLFEPAAETIFQTARNRVYTGHLRNITFKDGRLQLPDSIRPILEELPKYFHLAELLEEIERDKYLNPSIQESNATTLIMCSSTYESRHIRQYLQTMHQHQPGFGDQETEDEGETGQEPSAVEMLTRKFHQYLRRRPQVIQAGALWSEQLRKSMATPQITNMNHRSIQGRPPPNKRRRVRGGASETPLRPVSNGFTVLGGLEEWIDIEGDEVFPQQDIIPDEISEDSADAYFGLTPVEDLIVVHPYDGDADDHLLEEVKPRYIIMYTPDVAFIRRVELYRSSHTDRNVRVYFMYYEGSVEERRYLGSSRREKDAFSKMIREKGSMAMTMARPGLDDPQDHFLRINTRIAGGGRISATAEPPKIVVDVREFRSSLPSLLHGSSIQIIPVTLTVGDYILSPDMCVERKSVPDLQHSFKNGRLFNQVEKMSKHYKYPIVLIEFDQNKSFTLEMFGDRTSAINEHDIQSKLVLLTIHFPRLKLIWSSSPYQTAEIFQELKRKNTEPDPYKASLIGLGDLFNETPQDMLRTIPGVTSINMELIMRKWDNLAGLANASEEDIHAVVGREAGSQIFRFFNKNVFEV
jgi:DNA excision repair protein ERCC-4